MGTGVRWLFHLVFGRPESPGKELDLRHGAGHRGSAQDAQSRRCHAHRCISMHEKTLALPCGLTI